MSKKSSPKRTPSKRSASKGRTSPDLSGLVTKSADSEDFSELEKLFEEQFKEKSPTSKLTSSFGHVGLKESTLMRQPKMSSFGHRTIGLTAAERRQKLMRQPKRSSFGETTSPRGGGDRRRTYDDARARSRSKSSSPKSKRRRSRSRSPLK